MTWRDFDVDPGGEINCAERRDIRHAETVSGDKARRCEVALQPVKKAPESLLATKNERRDRGDRFPARSGDAAGREIFVLIAENF